MSHTTDNRLPVLPDGRVELRAEPRVAYDTEWRWSGAKADKKIGSCDEDIPTKAEGPRV